MKEPVVVPPSSQHISNETKCNQSTNEHYKKHRAQAKAHAFVLPSSLPSFDQPMHDVLEEVNTNNDVKMHDYDDSIRILDPILINLDE